MWEHSSPLESQKVDLPVVLSKIPVLDLALDRGRWRWWAKCTCFQNIHPTRHWLKCSTESPCLLFHPTRQRNHFTLTHRGFFSALTTVIFKEPNVSPYYGIGIVCFLPTSWAELRYGLLTHWRMTLTQISPVPICSVCMSVHSLEVWTQGFPFPHLTLQSPQGLCPEHSTVQLGRWDRLLSVAGSGGKGLCGIRRLIRVK